MCHFKSSLSSLMKKLLVKLFLHGYGERVAYPRHLCSTQVSIQFVVPLWESTPGRQENNRNMLLAHCAIKKQIIYENRITALRSSPAVDPRNMCESGFVCSTGLNVIAWSEDICTDTYNRCTFMVNGCTDQCASSLWQVCNPGSDEKNIRSGLNHTQSGRNIQRVREKKRRESEREGRNDSRDVYLSTRWSLVGCGAIVFLTYW